MSLDAIMRTALSGLSTNQSAMRTTSNNIANVNTPGFSRQEVILQTRAVDGDAIGVEVGEIRRIVDQFLNRELIGASANYGKYSAQAALHDRLQTVLGGPDSQSSLNNRIDALFEAFSTLAVDPTQTPRRIDAVAEIQSLADTFDRLAREVQSLREEADRQVQSEITVVNNALIAVHGLNSLIAQQRLSGGDTAGLEEQRQQSIEKIAKVIDIRATEQSDGFVDIATVAGLTLLDKDRHELQYTAPGQIDTQVILNSITVHRVNSNTNQAAATGTSLETSLRSGTLRGLIDMRDKELPEFAAALGELAGNIVDRLNGVHNDNTTAPPPNALTGKNVGALATDAHGFTGMVTFAVLDSNSEISDSHQIDFASGALTTLQDVINEVNANVTGATLALTNGVMSFTAGSGTDGVALLQNSTTPSSRGGRGFAHYFGMNDLLQGRAGPHFDTGLTTAATHGFGATGTAQIEFRGPGGQVGATHTLDFSTVGGTVANVLTDLNTGFTGFATFALDSNGQLTVTPASGFEAYDMAVRTDTTARGSTNVTFSDYFGVGERYRMDQAFSINVKSTIAADPTLLATAKLDTSAAAGTPAVTSGDNRGATELLALSTLQFSFDAAGDLPALTTSITGYSGYMLSTIGMEADRVSGMAEDREVLRDEIQLRRDSLAGVNLDEELSNMIIYQQAYNAAARLITTVNQMYDTLVNIGA